MHELDKTRLECDIDELPSFKPASITTIININSAFEGDYRVRLGFGGPYGALLFLYSTRVHGFIDVFNLSSESELSSDMSVGVRFTPYTQGVEKSIRERKVTFVIDPGLMFGGSVQP